MGIRYYAYAFDAEQTELALTDPKQLLSPDPLADAWGFPHGAVEAVTNFEQSVPKTEMLYLDKAWSGLQRLTAPTSSEVVPRPAYRMFEGDVTPHEWGWIPWVRAITPEELPGIATDLASLMHESSGERVRPDVDDYVMDYLKRATEYVTQLLGDNRGFVYTIG